MNIDLPWIIYSVLLTGALASSRTCRSPLEPIRITPSNASHEIGGAFSLHQNDCKTIRPLVVQELIAVQWALSYWNLNPINSDLKISLYAVDTCSDRYFAATQMYSYLEKSVGFDNECESETEKHIDSIGVILPPDTESNKNLPNTLSTFGTDGISYTSLTDSQSSISVVPKLGSYFKALVRILNSTNNNYISIIGKPDSSETKQLLNYLSKSDIHVERVFDISDDNLHNEMYNPGQFNWPDTVVIIANKSESIRAFEANKLGGFSRFYLFVPSQGEVMTAQEMSKLAMLVETSIVVPLQLQVNDMPELRSYFVDLLLNNYDKYPLLEAYMEQIYQCNLENTDDGSGKRPCSSLTANDIEQLYVQSHNAESVVMATFALASYAKYRTRICAPDTKCSLQDILRQSRFGYSFDKYDPISLRDRRIHFDTSTGELEGTIIHASQISKIGGRTHVTRVLEMIIGDPIIYFPPESIRWHSTKIQSMCSESNPKCRRCNGFVSSESVVGLSTASSDYINILAVFELLTDDCTTIDVNNVLDPLALLFTMSTIRDRYAGINILANVRIGSLMLDSSCQSRGNMLQNIHALTSSCVQNVGMKSNVTNYPNTIVAIASSLPASVNNDFKLVLEPLGIDQVVVSADKTVDKSNLFSISPSYDDQSRAISDTLTHFDWTYVSVVVSADCGECQNSFESFKQLVSQSKTCIASVSVVEQDVEYSDDAASVIVVLFTTAEDAAKVLETPENGLKKTYVFIGDSHNWEFLNAQYLPTRRQVSASVGAISVQPRIWPSVAKFKHYLATVNPQQIGHQWAFDLWEQLFVCRFERSRQVHSAQFKKCSGNEGLLNSREFANIFRRRMNKQSSLISATEALLFSVDVIRKKHCPDSEEPCLEFYNSILRELKGVLNEIPRESAFQIYNYRNSGDDRKESFVEIGNWSARAKTTVIEPYVWFSRGSEGSKSPPTSTCVPPLCQCHLPNDFFTQPLNLAFAPSMSGRASPRPEYKPRSQGATSLPVPRVRIPDYRIEKQLWKARTWSFIFLAINSILLTAALSALSLIIYKLCRQVVKGNQSLGICLLSGVVLLYACSYCFIFDPSTVICSMRYFLHSGAYAVVFGVLTVKAVQLRSSESSTANKTTVVSYWIYWLLLVFMFGVQLALNLQWLMIKLPVKFHVVHTSVGGSSRILVQQCNWSSQEFLFSQLYVGILLLLSLFLALVTRNVKRNYKEARWLLYTCVVCLPVWIAWMTAYAVVPSEFKDTVIVVELLTCATVVLCCMFGPKLYILVAYEAVLVPCQDTNIDKFKPQANFSNHIQEPYTRKLSEDDMGIPQVEEDQGFGSFRRTGANYHRRLGSALFGKLQRPSSPTDSSSGSTKSTVISSLAPLSHHGVRQSNSADSPSGTIYAAVVRKKSRHGTKEAPQDVHMPRNNSSNVHGHLANLHPLYHPSSLSRDHHRNREYY